MEKRYAFNEVTHLSAFVVGVPGKRTFFLIVGQEGEWVRLWLEKEQLETLALAIDQFLLTLSQKHLISSREAEGMPLSDDVPSGMPSAELEVDQITLGFNQQRATLNFLGHVSGPRKEDQAALYCRTTLAQLKKLGNQARSICAAGRPRCAVCGGPIDPTGHICPMNN